MYELDTYAEARGEIPKLLLELETKAIIEKGGIADPSDRSHSGGQSQDWFIYTF